MTETTIRRTTIITDPVHQVMDLGSDPNDRAAFAGVVDTGIFQRLRRISQLGLASYVFPGATHSRFSHSLGVHYLAYTVMRHLREAFPAETREIDELGLEVKLCALLHDVGHGPFSHSFENVLKSIAEIKNPPLHEDWTGAFIGATSSEIHRALQSAGLNTGRMASVFGVDSSEHFPEYLKQIISSQIDVDRMDYLVRDSHFAGVNVGKFDIQYLINSLMVVHHGGEGPKTLGLTPKGVKAYEAFALARQFMNRTVYYHRKVKVLEYMMEQFIREVLLNFKILDKRGLGPLVPQYLKSVANLIHVSAKSDKADFMSKNLKAYAELTEDSVWTLLAAIARHEGVLGEAERSRILAQKLLKRQVLPNHIIQPGREELLRERLENVGLIADVHFSVIKARTTTYKAASDDEVFVVDWDGGIDQILDHSELISVLRDKAEQQTLLVIIDEGKRTEIERLAAEMQAISLRGSIGKKRSKTTLQ